FVNVIIIITFFACSKNENNSISKTTLNLDKFAIDTVFISEQQLIANVGHNFVMHKLNDEFIITDETKSKLNVFNSEGLLVKTIGRLGSGPEEFKSIFDLQGNNDTLLVTDIGNARTAIINTSH